jgi:hydroxyethylthiazole kinase-like uncharacterized protein yjeF
MVPSQSDYSCALLTPEQMGQADRITIARGTDSFQLMMQAAQAAINIIMKSVKKDDRVLCLAGPGNNGGDAFCVAQILHENGYSVSVLAIQERGHIKGDALKAKDACQCPVSFAHNGDYSAYSDLIMRSDWIIDGLFGSGLSRDINGAHARLIKDINASEKSVIALDLPSGIDGTTGQVRGVAIKAEITVTFFRKKPGHCLVPGRSYCGDAIHICDIGIKNNVLHDIKPMLFENVPLLWRHHYRVPDDLSHKYLRGHVGVMSGGPWQTGASRMAAEASLRSGAGLVTIFSPDDALAIHAAHLTSIMLEHYREEDFIQTLARRKIRVFVAGPAMGMKTAQWNFLAQILSVDHESINQRFSLVMDADALTLLARHADLMQKAKDCSCSMVYTPHEGEFARLFPHIQGDCKWENARQAAQEMNKIIVYKGADTVIASPDGRCAVQSFASPWLSTAGSGDVLAGIVAAMLANGMPAFEAASMAVWLHARAADYATIAFAAEDLPKLLSSALADAIV